MIKIAPSILAADPMRMGQEVQRMVKAGCDWLHVDIMDGNFVPNLSYGPSLVKALKKEVEVPLDVHLMILHPEEFVDVFIDAGANILTVHQEATKDLVGLLRCMHEKGILAGVSLKPATPVSVLEGFLKDIDLVLIMTVEPGFGGQQFMPDMLLKIRELRRMGYQGIIEVDGGVGPKNAGILLESGATALVMGTALFSAENPAKIIGEMHAMAGSHV